MKIIETLQQVKLEKSRLEIEVAHLKAENARLREALIKISTPDPVVFDGMMAYSYKMIAREALKGGN